MHYHPDMGGSQTDMANINEAYHVLSDQFRRSLYDAERRRTLRVPPREPAQAQPVYTSHKQPSPSQYAYTAKQTAPKHKRSWWAALSWSFAVAIILFGILLQLPLAEANGSSGTTQTTAKPLSVSYPSDGSSGLSTATNASSDTNLTFYPATTTNQPIGTQPSQPQQTTNNTDSSCTNDSCSQTHLDKNCATKTASLYKRTACSL